ncbi:MAG TPA: hypothetical protein VL485_16830 [Ktedonobacteraceae bacterium]|jgi:hypothetical protein|nr:hypothetical protein [Ktedonobacteraceae bacterium]
MQRLVIGCSRKTQQELLGLGATFQDVSYMTQKLIFPDGTLSLPWNNDSLGKLMYYYLLPDGQTVVEASEEGLLSIVRDPTSARRWKQEILQWNQQR